MNPPAIHGVRDSAAPDVSLAKGLFNLCLLPLRLFWNVVVIVGAIALQIAWLGFVFGSVLGVIILLVFFPAGFLLPLGLLGLTVRLWPEEG